ncbi:MAG: Rho termination factor N-terminal domain-containing protein [bacterium]
MTDEKETPEAGDNETEAEVAEEVAEAEATEEAAEGEAAGEVAEVEATEETAVGEAVEEVAQAEEAVEVPEKVAGAETAKEARYTRGQLQQMTIKKLRDIALELGDIPGVHGMKKDELVESIFALRGQEGAEGALALAVDKTAIKQEIRGLKELRTSALEVGDAAELKRVRKRIKRLKRTLRKAS